MRVDLSGLPHELQYLAVDLLLRQLFWTMVLAGQASQLRGAIILDEAKLILARSRSDPLAILNRLASEGRKFGLMVLLAAQDLRHFSSDILDNVAAKLVLMHAETAIRSTASKLLLSEGGLLLLKKPFEGYLRKGGQGWEPVTITPYFARAK
jgi:DNA helicase HerA-like ATPase